MLSATQQSPSCDSARTAEVIPWANPWTCCFQPNSEEEKETTGMSKLAPASGGGRREE